MQLFDANHLRVGDDSPIEPGESLFQFLSSRDNLFAKRARLQIESLLSQYPDTHRIKLVRELQGKGERQFYGALLELVCWCLLDGAGLNPTPEPNAVGGSKPDFEIFPFGSAPTLVEATTDLGETDESKGQRAIHDLDVAAAKHITVPGYRLIVGSTRLQADQPPSTRAFGRFVDEQFKKCRDQSTQPDIADAIRGDGVPQIIWKDKKGNQVSFRIYRRTSGGLPGRLFGMGPMRGGSIDESRAVEKLKNKLHQHRKDDAPKVLVFANCCPMRTDRDESYAHRTLFGSERFHFRIPRYPNQTPVEADEAPEVSLNDDGLWSQIRNTLEPIAVLWIEALSPWHLDSLDGRLWHNPRQELFGLRALWQGNQAFFDLDYRLEKQQGQRLGSLLQLPVV